MRKDFQKLTDDTRRCFIIKNVNKMKQNYDIN